MTTHTFSITCEDAALPRLMNFLQLQSGEPNDKYDYKEITPTRAFIITCGDAALPRLMDFLQLQSGEPDDKYDYKEITPNELLP